MASRQVIDVESSGPRHPVTRCGSINPQTIRNRIWNFVAGVQSVIKNLLPVVQEDDLYSPTCPPSGPAPWGIQSRIREVVQMVWELISDLDFRLRYGFQMIEQSLASVTIRCNELGGTLLTVARRVARLEELVLLLDQTLSLTENQTHQLLFSRQGPPKAKSRPGSSAASRPLKRLRAAEAKAAAKRATEARNTAKLKARVRELEDLLDKTCNRVSRLMVICRNLEKRLREQSIIDGNLSERSDSDMD